MKDVPIKAQQKIEQIQKDSELRYRRLFETTQDGILILDAKTGMIEDVNPYLIKLLGYSRAELIKKKLWEVGAFKDIESSKKSFKFLQKEKYIRYENLPLKTKNGQMIEVEFVSNLYLVNNKKTIQCSIRDITEHRRIITALEYNEQTYLELINQSPDGFFVIASSGRLLMVNQAICQALGFSQKQLLSMNVWEIIPIELLKVYKERLEKVLSGKSLFEDTEYIVKGKDGQMRFVEILSAPHYSGKDIVGFQGIARDVTERKLVNAALKASESKFRSYTQNAPLGFFIVDRSGGYVEVNTAACEMLGYTEAELLQLSISEIVTPQSLGAGVNTFQELQQAAISELLFRRKDGTQFWATVNSVKLNEDRFMSFCEDISERKQYEKEIQNRLKDLELLYQSSIVFNQQLTPEGIANKIIDLLDQEMDWHQTTIRLYDPKTEKFELLAFSLPKKKGSTEHDTRKEKLDLIKSADLGLCGWAFQHNQVVRSDDLENDPRYTETIPGMKSGLYVPLKSAERVLGVISIESEETHAFTKTDEQLTCTLAGQAAVAFTNIMLFEDLQRSHGELELAYEKTLEGWSKALDLRDRETEGHTQRVTEVAVNLARNFGFSEMELVNVRRGGLLHDIGKMGVPDYILFSPDRLTEEEWKLMRMHPVYAYDLLLPITYLGNTLDIPHYHHERWDGSGYPDGLKGDQIPLVARIFAVVDVWDALLSDRPYRKAWPNDKVLKHLKNEKNKHFDPNVVDAFLKLIGVP